ncbi:hypothetical protein SKAU_G00094300 [Synaphobranchus kaupii]|uniref:CCHC-type domain-containing protein n=1 Tax=Synaphobranchus kaupii TaxID=118154 RepID=A0A9Q1FXH5_SYNKA|nr:hypothetical protein SKAU_G00094300 [Synaphobranchus kaupii]
MEQLQDEVSAVLWTLGKPELINVCQYLKCKEPTGEGFRGQPRRALIRLAESTLEDIKGRETGLFSEAVKFQLKPHLSNPRVTDEVLIEKVNEAAGLELERQNKLRRNTAAKPPRVSEIHTELQPNHSPLPGSSETDMDDETQTKGCGVVFAKKKTGQSKGLDPETAKLIEGLKADVLEVKKKFNETLEATKSRPTTDARRPPAAGWARGCQVCREAQVGDTCRHCYRCGQEGHLSRGCRQNRSTQGNGRGLLSRDPQ